MNRKNLFIGLCISFLAVFYVRASESPSREDFYNLPAEDFRNICLGSNSQHDSLHVFFKNGITTIGDIRKYCSGSKERDQSKDGLYLDLFRKIDSDKVIVCENTEITLLDGTPVHVTFVIVETSNCNVCALVKKYLEENEKLNGGERMLPEIDMKGKDLFSEIICSTFSSGPCWVLPPEKV